METYLIAARFIHFAAISLVFGGALFSLYAGNAGWRLLAGRNLRVWLASGSAVAVFSAILWGDAVAVTMAGSWIGASDPQLLETVLLKTAFGRVWVWRFVLAVALFAMLTSWRGAQATNGARLFVVICAGLLVASLAGAGHAVMLVGFSGGELVVAQALHVLAAGAWLGGLPPLGLVLWNARHSPATAPALDDLALVLTRFSTMGTIAVSIVAATGILSAVLVVRDLHMVIAAWYGRVLLAKICVFLLMTGVAADNRWRLSSTIRNSVRGADAQTAVSRLTQNVAIELGFGAFVLALVAILGTLSPG